VLCVVFGFVVTEGGQKADAGFIINVVQSGNNVVATGRGSLNLTALTKNGFDSYTSWTNPSDGDIFVGNRPSGNSDIFRGISGNYVFGTGRFIPADQTTGRNKVGIWNGLNGVLVPDLYVSGTDLGVSTATWTNQTLDTLGMTPGLYAWTWGSGSTYDLFVVDVVGSSVAVPEPSSFLLASLGIFSSLVTVVRKKRKAIAG
jgi:hypothetical protein